MIAKIRKREFWIPYIKYESNKLVAVDYYLFYVVADTTIKHPFGFYNIFLQKFSIVLTKKEADVISSVSKTPTILFTGIIIRNDV